MAADADGVLGDKGRTRVAKAVVEYYTACPTYQTFAATKLAPKSRLIRPSQSRCGHERQKALGACGRGKSRKISPGPGRHVIHG
jgi:hypothetical protein